MSAENTNKENMKAALTALSDSNFLVAVRNLLGTLGYHSQRTLELSGGADDFIRQFPAASQDTTRSEQEFRERVGSVQLVFQLTSEEIAPVNQPTLGLEAASFDTGTQRSFIFVAVELKEASYARSRYAEFTREINKRLIAPTVILFKTAANRLTLAFVHRRQHRHDHSRDVLGSVSLVREINPTQPHRAHLDILAELSLENLLSWMSGHNKPSNFDGLLAAWLDTLNTEALNKRFYTELFRWFEWAVGEATFPTQEEKVLQPEEHIIRLITRLLFVWFIKEKGLVAEDVFNETQIADLLRNYDGDTGDTYYRAVLQNLFFATLNTEMDKRGFSTTKNSTHRNFSRYRYKSEISDPEKLLALFARTPFINGGLFDCLDSEEGIRDGGYRIDCFSDNERHYTKLSIPNRLFFDPERGLFPLLNHYKFTVEENTPIEQEVALDPELLGKVFENLLAAYNPETRQTARKQTGSYYTPRAVVDYMVDEALVAALAQKCSPADSGAKFWQERLHYLLNYEDAFNDADELFDAQEAEDIVRAIADLTVLDPAVGSGAFPMGVLHKLTLALGRIDPTNTRWAALQKERAREKADAAFETRDQQERDTELLEISETFEKYSGDFGRKLYLIQNSIFGVDIQPIAGQIAKLRFFISLAIEQEPHKDAKNFGIRPLPNLETRFIAADTLLSLYKPAQLSLGQTEAVTRLERELSANRERHFHATTRRKKLACRKRDRELRDNLGAELQQVGWSTGDANKIAQWDPYDQNAKADWFDAEHMFGVVEGFDVVIGNPPYVSYGLRGTGKMSKAEKERIFKIFPNSAEYKISIYALFMERSIRLCKITGISCLIVPDSFLLGRYFSKIRNFILSECWITFLLLIRGKVFDNVTVGQSVIYLFQRTPHKQNKQNTQVKVALGDENYFNGEQKYIEYSQRYFESVERVRFRLFFDQCVKKIVQKLDMIEGLRLDSVLRFRSGLIAKSGQTSIRGRTKRGPYWEPGISSGGMVMPYRAAYQGDYLCYEPSKIKSGGVNAVNYFQPKLFVRQTGDTIICAYDGENLLSLNNVHVGLLVRSDRAEDALKYVCAVLNSKVIQFYYSAISLEKGRVLAQIDIDVLNAIPVPAATVEQKRMIAQLVDNILDIKCADPEADTAKWETEIDRLVYGLYGLTAGEIAAVEGTL